MLKPKKKHYAQAVSTSQRLAFSLNRLSKLMVQPRPTNKKTSFLLKCHPVCTAVMLFLLPFRRSCNSFRGHFTELVCPPMSTSLSGRCVYVSVVLFALGRLTAVCVVARSVEPPSAETGPALQRERLGPAKRPRPDYLYTAEPPARRRRGRSVGSPDGWQVSLVTRRRAGQSGHQTAGRSGGVTRRRPGQAGSPDGGQVSQVTRRRAGQSDDHAAVPLPVPLSWSADQSPDGPESGAATPQSRRGAVPSPEC